MDEVPCCTQVQETTVRAQISKAQGKAARSVVDSAPLRQPVVRSGDAIHRPAARLRRTSMSRITADLCRGSGLRGRRIFSGRLSLVQISFSAPPQFGPACIDRPDSPEYALP